VTSALLRVRQRSVTIGPNGGGGGGGNDPSVGGGGRDDTGGPFGPCGGGSVVKQQPSVHGARAFSIPVLLIIFTFLYAFGGGRARSYLFARRVSTFAIIGAERFTRRRSARETREDPTASPNTWFAVYPT